MFSLVEINVFLYDMDDMLGVEASHLCGNPNNSKAKRPRGAQECAGVRVEERIVPDSGDGDCGLLGLPLSAHGEIPLGGPEREVPVHRVKTPGQREPDHRVGAVPQPAIL